MLHMIGINGGLMINNNIGDEYIQSYSGHIGLFFWSFILLKLHVFYFDFAIKKNNWRPSFVDVVIFSSPILSGDDILNITLINFGPLEPKPFISAFVNKRGKLPNAIMFLILFPVVIISTPMDYESNQLVLTGFLSALQISEVILIVNIHIIKQ